MTGTIGFRISLIACVIFGVLRFTLPVSGLNSADVFKDLAHVFVGGLFGAAIATKKPSLWILAASLTVFEVVAALLRSH